MKLLGDFSFWLVVLTLFSGVVWLVDSRVFARRRRMRSAPWIVEYSRSLFPVFLIVLLLRSFLFEPYRIPSASMMPTLQIGDFILVNKYEYGLRLPLLHKKIISVGSPGRGDVVIFRFPLDPSIPYIKRIVGMPGDLLEYKHKKLFINGKEVEQQELGDYFTEGKGAVMNGFRWRREFLPGAEHDILLRQENDGMDGYVFRTKVPENEYFVLGDNRDNSKDSRFWGFVPEELLVGKAFMIWMHWDWSGKVIDFSRIGQNIP